LPLGARISLWVRFKKTNDICCKLLKTSNVSKFDYSIAKCNFSSMFNIAGRFLEVEIQYLRANTFEIPGVITVNIAIVGSSPA
jgi:hypothetical protein